MDIVSWLLAKENRCLKHKGNSPQIDKRSQLIEWLVGVSGKLGLSSSTMHLAVKLLIMFMDGHDIQNPQLYLVSLGSLLIAAKLEEKDGNVPSASQLNAFVKEYFPLKEYTAFEFVLLGYFKWDIWFPTPCDFVMLMLPCSIHPSDKHNSGPLVSYEKARAYFEEYVRYFLSVSLTDILFVDVPSSRLAAAIIMASRRAFGLSPHWPECLELMVNYKERQLSFDAEQLLRHHQLTSMFEDEGYRSINSSPMKPSESTSFCSFYEF